MASAAAAGVQYIAAGFGPSARRQGAARLTAALPGPAAGAVLFSVLSGNSFFVIYRYGWLPVLAAGLLGARSENVAPSGKIDDQPADGEVN
jgi:hypothetical protein